VVVTHGAVAPGDHNEPDPALAAVWGLVRAARAEAPERFALLDIDAAAESWSAVTSALGSGEPELAIREGVVYAPRLGRASTGILTAPGSAWRLDIAEKGTLEGLALTPVERMELG